MPKVITKSEKQKSAEADVEDFREDLGPFVVAAETTRMAMVFTDAKAHGSPIIFANDAFLALTGYAREEVLGQSFNFLMAHGADAEALKQIRAEFENEADAGSEINYRRKDGGEFWAALFISPVRDEDGDIVQHFASFVDLTRHKEEQAESRMLIDELNHRVKNTLATVQSIVWQATRTYSDPNGIREAIESRLFALSRSHDLLTRQNRHSAGLRDVVDDALAPFGGADGLAGRVTIRGENIRFPPKAALAEMLVLLMIEDMLGELGCKSVTTAATIERALALVTGQDFDVAMLDMNLGGSDSRRVADALAARGVPFVYCTGNSNHGAKDGPDGRALLRKPFSFEELTASIRSLLFPQQAPS